MGVKIADKLEQMNGQSYALMDASAVEYEKSDGTKVRVNEMLDNIPSGKSYTTEEIDNLLKNKANTSDIPTVTNDLTNELKTQYDGAVEKEHDHSNKDVLDKFSEADNGDIQYNGKKIEVDVDAYTKTESDEKFAAKDHTHTTVNGHTVESDVPENAKFTDTVYDDTDIKTELGKKANTEDIPTVDVTKEYVDNALTSKVDNTALTEYTKTKDLKTKLSELENDTEFITATVENLKNYYLKTETYSQEEVNTLISNINKLTADVVTELPSTDISTSTIYLILIDAEKNIYSQNMYIHDKWATFGTTSIDLSKYVKTETLTAELKKKADVGANISGFTNDANYQTEDDLSQALTLYAKSATVSNHITNNDIHMSAKEKENLNNAVEKSHEHTNKKVLDKFSESDSGEILYNGSKIVSDSTVDAYTKKESDEKYALKDHTHTTVNGHTVESDVPENAKFTDTVYDDTDIKKEISGKANTSDIPTVTNDLTNELKEGYDDAVAKKHEHDNKDVLDKFSEADGSVLFDGKAIQGSGADIDAYTKKEVDDLLKEKIPTVTNDLTNELKTKYDDAAKKAHEHTNLAVLENLSTDGNDLFFKGVNVTNVVLPDGGRSYPVVMLDAKANMQYSINISSGYKECDLLVQAWKFTEGTQNVEGIVKMFNNSDSNNFYYSDNVEFTDSLCKIKDLFNIKSTVNTGKNNLYFGDEIDVSAFNTLIDIEEEG